MDTPAVASVTVAIATLYFFCGCGTISLIKQIDKTFPKVFGIFWPIFLVLSAFGMFEK